MCEVRSAARRRVHVVETLRQLWTGPLHCVVRLRALRQKTRRDDETVNTVNQNAFYTSVDHIFRCRIIVVLGLTYTNAFHSCRWFEQNLVVETVEQIDKQLDSLAGTTRKELSSMIQHYSDMFQHGIDAVIDIKACVEINFDDNTNNLILKIFL